MPEVTDPPMSSLIYTSPAAPGSGRTDEISVPTGGLTLRQRDKHTIGLDLRLPTGDTRRYRFRSANAPKGAGICLRTSDHKPPGSGINRPGYPEEVASHNLRQGSIHIRKSEPDGYRIELRQGQRAGALLVTPRNPRQDAVILTAASA